MGFMVYWPGRYARAMAPAPVRISGVGLERFRLAALLRTGHFIQRTALELILQTFDERLTTKKDLGGQLLPWRGVAA